MKKLLYFIAVLFAVIAMSGCENQHNTESMESIIYINKGQKVLSASFAYGGHLVILTETADSGYTPKVKTLVDYSYRPNSNGVVDNVLAIYKLVEQ